MMVTKVVLNHEDTKDAKKGSRGGLTLPRRFVIALCSLWLCGSLSPSSAQEATRRLTLQLPDSAAVDTAKALSGLLGADVTGEGAGARRAGLLVKGDSPAELLDRVAGA